MACRLFGAKPLFEPTLAYCWLDPWDLVSMKRETKYKTFHSRTWWRHQMETFSALPAICAGNSSVSGEFPAQRPVTRSFDISFDLRLNKRLSKQSWSWWFETLSCPLWRQCNEMCSKTSSAFCLDLDVVTMDYNCLSLFAAFNEHVPSSRVRDPGIVEHPRRGGPRRVSYHQRRRQSEIVNRCTNAAGLRGYAIHDMWIKFFKDWGLDKGFFPKQQGAILTWGTPQYSISNWNFFKI